jgi:tryptophan synthase beta chain
MRDWVASSGYTHYIIGSVVGPHPYPMMVRDFQSVIGNELKGQLKQIGEKEPDYLIACVGGGSNSMGLFYPFFNSRARFIGVEAGGMGVNTKKHAATLSRGSIGVLHGSKSYLLQDDFGQIKIAHSVSAGLDYPGVGPEHSFYKKIRRAGYVSVNDREAVEGMRFLSETEGIIPALESAHAVAYLRKLKMRSRDVCVLCLSGRGDKDIDIIRNKIEF